MEPIYGHGADDRSGDNGYEDGGGSGDGGTDGDGDFIGNGRATGPGSGDHYGSGNGWGRADGEGMDIFGAEGHGQGRGTDGQGYGWGDGSCHFSLAEFLVAAGLDPQLYTFARRLNKENAIVLVAQLQTCSSQEEYEAILAITELQIDARSKEE